MTILVTGSAGFIGFHLIIKLLSKGETVIGIDNLNSYYDPLLKNSRLEKLKSFAKENNYNYFFEKLDISNLEGLKNIFERFNPQRVINLAAQAGVRHSIKEPLSYYHGNILGFGNLIECCKIYKVEHFIYASSSSVYGGNTEMPFCENHNVDNPISLYAATKRSNELIAHTYSHLYQLPTTGLRFFTVYGPWGRPDMALFIFTKSIIEDKEIQVFNYGDMLRDFTYIDDVVESVFRVIYKTPQASINHNSSEKGPSQSWAPFKLLNIGNSKPTQLMKYIQEIELCLNKKAKIKFCALQKGDVKKTYADTIKLQEWINYKPNTSIKEGIAKFIKWYIKYYRINS